MTILLHIDRSVATVTISQPAKHNAVSPAMWDSLAETFTSLSSNPQVRAIVLTGAGNAFCSGSDLGEIDSSGNVADGLARLKRANRMILAIHNCDKPVIAAVRGAAVGVGWSLALACDLSIAAENARFIAGFTRIGLVPDGGAIWFLSRLMGVRQAKDIVYRARPVGAAEALALGLVNAVAAEQRFDAAVRELADDLAARPTHALGLTKRMFRDVIAPGLGTFLESEEMAQVVTKQSGDFAEGVAAFKEKRSPRFAGR
jgi:2-(1,2-epoxy-1,2-dihydrophenyl)acetyl-CoA isomerase